MAMPAANSHWLPKPWDEAYKAYALNEAWYLGDTDTLADLYQSGGNTRPTHMHKGQPHQGGVMGGLSKFFWGRPVPAAENRTRIHLPAPADLAMLASDTVWAEPPTIKLEGDQKEAQKRLDLIANSDQARATYNQMGELKSAIGAAVMTVRWDTELADHVWLEASGADVAIPTFKQGILTDVTLFTQFVDGNTTYRHLEHHAKGYIEHALYAGTYNNLGRRIPLQDRPETADYALLVDKDSRIATGIDFLTAVWNINQPTRAWRKRGQLAWAGRSDFTNQMHPLFDALDETFSSWMRDIKLGAGKMIIPEALANIQRPGSGASFDLNQELFIKVPGRPNPEDPSHVDKVQFAIRVEEHERTIQAIYREILRNAGYSQSAWGDYGGQKSQQTATEVVNKDKASERTRDKKILYEKDALSRITRAALAMDKQLFNTGKYNGKELPTVTFPKVSQEDPEKLARTIQILDAAQAVSAETKVRMWNQNLTDAEVTEEVQKIKEANSFTAPDITSDQW